MHKVIMEMSVFKLANCQFSQGYFIGIKKKKKPTYDPQHDDSWLNDLPFWH